MQKILVISANFNITKKSIVLRKIECYSIEIIDLISLNLEVFR